MWMCWMLIKHKGIDKQIFHKALHSTTSAHELIWMLMLAVFTSYVTDLSMLLSRGERGALRCPRYVIWHLDV